MSLSREQMLLEMGITPLWVLRDAVPNAPAVEAASALPVETDSAPPPVANQAPVPIAAPLEAPAPRPLAAPQDSVDTLEWPELARRVAECRACPLCEQRKQAVLGEVGS